MSDGLAASTDLLMILINDPGENKKYLHVYYCDLLDHHHLVLINTKKTNSC